MVSNTDSSAITDETYGTVHEIKVAPNFRWTYTPTYPSDLTVTTTIQTQGTNTGSSATSSTIKSGGTWASMSGGTLTVTVPGVTAAGTVYDVILKASVTTPIAQTAYQYVRVIVTNGLAVSGSINDIIEGASVNFSPTASSDVSEIVTWSITSGKSLPAGLTLSGNIVSGTPTIVGTNMLFLTATCAGEIKNLVVSFVVYNVIVGESSETIYSHGNSVSSAIITQTGSDLKVTWAVTSGTLPAGFSLDTSTGAVSGSSVEHKTTALTITGTAANGPTQSISKNITISTEPVIQISGDDSILTYAGNATTVSKTMTATANTSMVTWSLEGAPAGVTINLSGMISVSGSAAATTGTTFTVKAVSEYGQIVTRTITLIVESKLVLSGSSVLNTIAGTPATSTFTATGGSSNAITIDTASVPVGAIVNMQNGTVTLSDSAAAAPFTVDITVTSAAGQTDTITMTMQVSSKLVFTTLPSNGTTAYAV